MNVGEVEADPDVAALAVAEGIGRELSREESRSLGKAGVVPVGQSSPDDAPQPRRPGRVSAGEVVGR